MAEQLNAWEWKGHVTKEKGFRKVEKLIYTIPES